MVDSGLEDGNGKNTSPLTVLVVDDEPSLRAFASTILRSCGYEVLEAVDGVEALRLADRKRGCIHLLLTDWEMPELNGRDLVRCINTRYPQTPVLVMSGSKITDLPRGVAYLPKPFSAQDLELTVQEVLTRSQSRLEIG